MESLPYLPGDEPQKAAPLARFLPPVPDGLATAFLSGHAAPGGWILDPLGASPRLAAEAAAQGRRVLAAVNNPVGRFLLELAADPPAQADLSAALAELGAARKGAERLETHLQSLYLTPCSKCQRQVPAEAFIWERESGALVSRIYRCECGDNGEHPATELDRERAAALAATDGLHRARALERVAAPHDPDRKHAQEALECYLPRAVYALITIVNKLDGLLLTPARRRALLALVLGACDEGSALWPVPGDRPRPKQLSLPGKFLERNVWLALERGVELWAGEPQPGHVTVWPELPGQAGGLCLFEGPMRDLAPHLKELNLAAVLTAIPRPNQAFWTLSALWAGWLWGPAAAAPFKSVLRRRRYDWNWHAAALYGAFKNFAGQIPLNAPVFTIIPELEPAFLSAAMLAAAGAGLELGGLALRTRQDPAQVLWHRSSLTRSEDKPANIDAPAVKQAIHSLLQERGEPLPYLYLHAAGLASMAEDRSLGWREEALNQVHAPILAALAGPQLLHLGDSPNPESGLWAPAAWDTTLDPLPDRVEIAVVKFLHKNPGCSLSALEHALNQAFAGLLTPSLGLLRAVLASYATQAAGGWSLRPEEAPSARRSDLEAALDGLLRIGRQLGYSVTRDESNPRLVRWLEAGLPVYNFHVLASALVEKLLRQTSPGPGQNCLALPGGRAGLLAYKLERDPGLRALAAGWRVIKFRQLRRLAALSSLTRDQLTKEFSGDPIEPPEQMKMF